MSDKTMPYGIFEMLFEDYDERHAPPSHEMLRVSLSGDILFLDIVRYNETNKTRTIETVASVGVYAVPFVHGVNALTQGQIQIAKNPVKR